MKPNRYESKGPLICPLICGICLFEKEINLLEFSINNYFIIQLAQASIFVSKTIFETITKNVNFFLDFQHAFC